MKICKQAALAAVFLLTAFGGVQLAAASDKAESDLDTIIAEHTAARGGAAALEHLRSVEIELTITEPEFTVNAIYRASRVGKMRIDIYAGGERVFTEGFDGKHGWQLPGGATAGIDMSEKGEAAVQHGIIGNLLGLHEYAPLGHALSLIGEEMIDGVDHWVVEVRFNDGFIARNYIDKQTGLVNYSREVAALHPDVDEQIRRFQTRIFDHAVIDGILFARQTEKVDQDTGQVVQHTIARRISVNPEIDPTVYERP